MSQEITEQEVALAQQAWGEGIVKIGKVFTDGGDFSAAAEEHLDTLYAFEQGPVLFKPTKAAAEQFRLTRESALSYFVGGNAKYAEDHGFAINPWTNVRFENVTVFIRGDYAVAMGNYYFTQVDGQEVKVEYSFGYLKGADGRLKINLHHSSLPFAG
ncbi:MAG: hypothetical protein H8E79_07715 [Desulfobulbaceae bacterium]|uniref:Phosphoribosyl-AMP cyclohydrolase n=1 Tax=Candidatus Desulfatifera sulfidica TaxID=2841691 RepID=A0A8J6N8R6_9BACT|nr:hypothetical protein [Candidatus Desulfatifera sulfidica]